ncbi:MAG: DUF2793 domain-containing protein [Pseudomonadota bacterium]
MPDSLTTARLALPLLVAGQAQKEITHNEALTLIDALLFPVAESVEQNAPPAAPAPGQCWLVGAAPTGLWTGNAHALALWTSAGWRFATLPQGSRVAVGSSRTLWNRGATGWQSATSIALPTGGTTIDSECRAAVTALVQVLRVTGIIVDT